MIVNKEGAFPCGNAPSLFYYNYAERNGMHGLKEEALSIQTAVSESMNAGIVTEDIAGTSAKSYHTDEVGEWIVQWIKSH